MVSGACWDRGRGNTLWADRGLGAERGEDIIGGGGGYTTPAWGDGGGA